MLKKFTQFMIGFMFFSGVFLFADGFSYETKATVTQDTYKVKSGDTLYQLAKQYGTSVDWLKRENDLSSDRIDVGQILVVPMKDYLIHEMYAVVTGSFSNKANAGEQIQYLKEQGIDAIVVPQMVNEQQLYRIQAGVFSNREKAEKQRKVVQEVGVGDAYILPKKSLHLNGFPAGGSYEQFIMLYGEPLFFEDQSNTRSLFYHSEAAGAIVKINMKDGSIHHLQVDPGDLKNTLIPKKKQDVIKVYGEPNEIQEVSCPSGNCEQYLYYFNGDQLTVQLDVNSVVRQAVIEKMD